MVTRIRFIKFLLAFLLLPGAGWADDEPALPLRFTGHYSLAFSGIYFGEVDIALNQIATSYDAVADVKTTGIARLFVRHESHTTSKGKGKNFNYGNVEYESKYFTNKKEKYAHIRKQNGRVVLDKVTPPDDRKVRPAVLLADKSAAFDPLAVGLAIRTEFYRAQKDGRQNFTLDFYDGRRLTQATFKVEPERVITVGGQALPVYTLKARRKAIAGYTQKELSRMSPNEADLTMYFSHDARFIPVQMEVPVAWGIATATLRM